MDLTTKFRCPECGGMFSPSIIDSLTCAACGTSVPLLDGIADFVRSRFDTMLDVASYDLAHGIDDQRPDQFYNKIRIRAGHRWPAALGSVIEVGCGTGLYSRALVAAGEASEFVLTDVSVAMLRQCRGHLQRLGLLKGRDITFATYSSNEACLRDVAFDTVVGTSVLHHILDVRSFLEDVYRSLKPGGVAFFLEPARRFHHALAQSLADITVHLLKRQSSGTKEFQPLLNWLAQQRQSLLHHGDRTFLSRLEDKHQFVPEEFADLAGRIGFASGEAIPFDADPSGARTAYLLCGELGIGPPTRESIAALMPAMGGRFMKLLSPQECAPTFLLWLTKSRSPNVRTVRNASKLLMSQPHGPDPGDIPARWQIRVVTSANSVGALAAISGWYVSNVDIVGIRVTLDGTTQDAPVWLPRPDVQQAINSFGQYANWNALCCGVGEQLQFRTDVLSDGDHTLQLDAIMSDGAIAAISGPDQIRMGSRLDFAG